MPKLIHTRGGQPYREYNLKAGTYTVGRRPDSKIQIIDDVTVSGSHAKISVSKSKYMNGLFEVIIEDQKSTNGTLLNNKPIKKHRWKHGELVKIGSHEFTLIDEATRAFEETSVILPEDTQRPK